MRKTLKRTLGILAVSAMIPISAWATGEIKGPPQWAFDACAGKNAGDAVQLTTPGGKTVSAVCKEFDGKLAAKPSREGNHFRKSGKGQGWGGPHHRQRHDAETGYWKAGKGFCLDNSHMAKALNLTPEQQTEIRTIINNEHQKNATLFEQLRSTRDNFREAVLKSPFDEEAVRKIASEREKLRTELMVSWASAINRAMALLTPEQKETAAKIGIFKHGMEPGQGWGKGHGHGMGRKWKDGPRDGRGPNPDCPFKK